MVSSRVTPQSGEWILFGLIGLIYAAQIALLLTGYRLFCQPRRRDHSHTATGVDSPAVSPPPSVAHGAGTESRAEWRAFSIVVGCLALLVAGGLITIRELQLRQIPAPVWALLRESPGLEMITYDLNAKRIENGFPVSPVIQRVSLTTPRERALLVAALRRALTGWSLKPGRPGTYAHAIHLSSDTTKYVLNLSFDGRAVSLAEPDKVDPNPRTLFGSSEELEALFRAAPGHL